MAQFTIYRSTDDGAPTLNGYSGSLVTVLNAVLVDGYGTKSGAGWTKEYSGVSGAVESRAAYRGGAGTQFYLHVNDSGPTVQNHARINGYESMTHIDSGTNSFPSVSQGLGGYVSARKSSAVSATARTWIIAADNRTFYMFILTGDSTYYYGWMFGDFYSYVNEDQYNCMIIGQTNDNSSSYQYQFLETLGTITAAVGGHFLARPYHGIGSSVAASKVGNASFGYSTAGHGYMPFPNPSDGAIFLSPVMVADPSTAPVYSIRGKMRGMWHFLHLYASVSMNDTYSGVGDLAGRAFMHFKPTICSANIAGNVTLETSDTVDTN